MDAEADAGSSLAVCIGEGDRVGRLKGTASGDSELVAGDIVLRSTSRACCVQSNCLSSQKIIASGEILRDREAELATYKDISGKHLRRLPLCLPLKFMSLVPQKSASPWVEPGAFAQVFWYTLKKPSSPVAAAASLTEAMYASTGPQ